MEETIALIILCSRRGWVKDFASLGINIAGIEELIELIAWLAAVGHVWPDIVKIPEALRERDVGCVGEAGGAENDHAVLI